MKRRTFLTSSAAATFGFQVVPAHVVRAQGGGIAPNSKVRIAAIGCGGRAAADLDGMAGEDIVALCDVDERNGAASFKKWPNAKRFTDFRKMLDEVNNEIDAVLVGTPDHTHCVAAIAAMEHGKHVYCEKPLAHSVAEVRAMRKKALEKKVITQVGNQGHSSHDIRRFVELIHAGAVGKVTEVHAGCDAYKEVYCQINKREQFAKEKPPVPAGLDWDLWLGPAAKRDYHPGYVPFAWRGIGAFGCGCLGDWVCHVLDPVFWALDLDVPHAITAETKGYDPKTDGDFFPKGTRITFEFAAKGERGPLKILWHDGDFSIPQPEELTQENRKVTGTGAVVIGDKGKIMYGSHGAGGVGIIPSSKQKEFKHPDETITRVKNGDHHKDWLDAIRENRPAGSNFEYGGALSEVGLLGVVAIRRTGVRLEWDAKQMKFTNDAEANQFITPVFRDGWKIAL